MDNRFTGWMVALAAMVALFIGTAVPGAAQDDFDGRQVAAALTRKDYKPAPRLAADTRPAADPSQRPG